MKLLITTGHASSGIEVIWPLLRACDISDAAPALTEINDPGKFHQKLYQARKVGDAELPGQINPGRMWQSQAENLLINNVESDVWGWADARSSRLLDFWAGVDESIHFVLLYVAPEVALAMATENTREGTGEAALDPLASWREKNAELLNFYSRNRDRCLLLNTFSLLARPDQLGELLNDRFGMTNSTKASSGLPEIAYWVSALNTLVARNRMEDAEAAMLFEELETASDLPTQSNHTKQELTRAWTEHVRLAGKEIELNQALTTIQSTKNALTERTRELEQARSEIKEAASKKSAEEQEKAKLARKITELNTELEKQQQINKEQGSENELLLLQLNQVQEELESHYLRGQEVERKLKQSTQALEVGQQEMLALQSRMQGLEKDKQTGEQEKAKFSKQITELNAELEKQRQINKEQGSDNELLLLQLHQVQEELESLCLRDQEAESKIKQSTQALEVGRQEMLALQNRMQGLEKDKLAGEQDKSGMAKRIAELEATLKQSRQDSETKAIQLADDKTALGSQVQQIKAELDGSKKKLAELQQRASQAEQDRQNTSQDNTQLRTRIATLENDLGKARKNAQEQSQENELLLLQLHQVQDVLETYFLKYQELPAAKPENTTTPVATQLKPVDNANAPPDRKFGLMQTYLEKHKSARKLKRQVVLIQHSGLFDTQWYLKEYADVAKSGIDPIKHYLKFGADEGRDPSLRFDTRYYQRTNPDLQNSTLNPLIHYISHGKEEGRKPHP